MNAMNGNDVEKNINLKKVRFFEPFLLFICYLWYNTINYILVRNIYSMAVKKGKPEESLWQVWKDIIKDKRLDKSDLESIKLLNKKIDAQKDIFSMTRNELHEALKKSLYQGYTIHDESDYNTFVFLVRNVLKDSSVSIPKYIPSMRGSSFSYQVPESSTKGTVVLYQSSSVLDLGFNNNVLTTDIIHPLEEKEYEYKQWVNEYRNLEHVKIYDDITEEPSGYIKAKETHSFSQNLTIQEINDRIAIVNTAITQLKHSNRIAKEANQKYEEEKTKQLSTYNALIKKRQEYIDLGIDMSSVPLQDSENTSISGLKAAIGNIRWDITVADISALESWEKALSEYKSSISKELPGNLKGVRFGPKVANMKDIREKTAILETLLRNHRQERDNTNDEVYFPKWYREDGAIQDNEYSQEPEILTPSQRDTNDEMYFPKWYREDGAIQDNEYSQEPEILTPSKKPKKQRKKPSHKTVEIHAIKNTIRIKHNWVKQQLRRMKGLDIQNPTKDQIISILTQFKDASFSLRSNQPKNSALAIYALQVAISMLLPNNSMWSIDGVFAERWKRDSNTKKSLKRLQSTLSLKGKKLVVDGIPGKNTITAILEKLNDI